MPTVKARIEIADLGTTERLLLAHQGYGYAVFADINGDGFTDIALAEPLWNDGVTGNLGRVAIMYGAAAGFGSKVDTATDVDVAITGTVGDAYSGGKIANAGDINGDGFADIISINNFLMSSQNGSVDIIFGGTAANLQSIDNTALDGSNGFRILGLPRSDWIDSSVGTAGDFNGDGIDDILISSGGLDGINTVDRGSTYVIFGRTTGFGPTFDLASPDGISFIRFDGVAASNRAGSYSASIGDVNDDGRDDIAISATVGTYIVYGGNDYSFDGFALSQLNGTRGYLFLGAGTGGDVAAAGDLNSDGIDDFAVRQVNGTQINVVFGDPLFSGATFQSSALDGSNGFRIVSSRPNELLNASLSTAGDFNGDGLDDLLIGSTALDVDYSNGLFFYGGAVVVFGRATGFPALVDINRLDGTDGLRFTGPLNSSTGGSVRAAGDINRDGFDDFFVAGNDENFQVRGTIIYGHATGSLDRTGTEFADILSGGGWDDTFDGRGGDDFIRAGDGDDRLMGGADNDTMMGGGGDDVVDGGSGNDRVGGGAGEDTIRTGSGNDTILWSSDDTIYAGSGSDTLDFSGVTTRLKIDLAKAIVSGAPGPKTTFFAIENIVASRGDDAIAGTVAGESINGVSGADQITALGGNDWIVGGAGADILAGGKGADTFVWSSASHGGDRITDFAAGDRLAFAGSAFGALSAGAIDAGMFITRNDNKAQDADDHFIFRTTDSSLWFDANGSTAGGLKLVAKFGVDSAVMGADILIL